MTIFGGGFLPARKVPPGACWMMIIGGGLLPTMRVLLGTCWITATIRSITAMAQINRRNQTRLLIWIYVVFIIYLSFHWVPELYIKDKSEISDVGQDFRKKYGKMSEANLKLSNDSDWRISSLHNPMSWWCDCRNMLRFWLRRLNRRGQAHHKNHPLLRYKPVYTAKWSGYKRQ